MHVGVLNSHADSRLVCPTQVRYLWREWGHNKHVLEDVQKELKLEKQILNALVPKVDLLLLYYSRPRVE